MEKSNNINGCNENTSSDRTQTLSKKDSMIKQTMETSEISSSEKKTENTKEGKRKMLEKNRGQTLRTKFLSKMRNQGGKQFTENGDFPQQKDAK